MKKTEGPSDHKLLFEMPLAVPASGSHILDVHVVFTNLRATMQAVERAASLAKDLHARLCLLVPQVVSYELPLDSPPVLVEFNEARFRRLAATLDVDMRVEIYLCRDAMDVLTKRLAHRSLVVVGGIRRWWWPTREWWLARRLGRLGHEVALVNVE